MRKLTDTRGTFRTISTIIDPVKYSVDDVAIEDIAEGLCKANRFSGQYEGDHMVTVAQHAVRVSRIMKKESALAFGGYGDLNREMLRKVFRYALIGLLHDGAESYTGDMPTPYKRMMPDFRRVENKIQDTIYEALLGESITDDDHKFLSCVDFRVFNMECKALGRPTISDPNIARTAMEGETFHDHFGTDIWWDIPESRAVFLNEFEYLNHMFTEYSE